LTELLRGYLLDPIGFAWDMFQIELTEQQEEFVLQVAANKRVSCRSGHGVGKSMSFAVLDWWYIMTRPNSQVFITGPSSQQLYDVVWKEIVGLYRRMPQAFQSMFEVTKQRIWHKSNKEGWFTQARTARKDQPDALQGRHGEHMMFLVDEAFGVPDAIYETVEGALTETDNKIALAGNPTRLSGYAYQTFHAQKDGWVNLHFSSKESPLVNPEYYESMEQRYGVHTGIYMVRVLGEFPHAEPDQLISITDAREAVGRDVTMLSPVIWGVDVAAQGDDETVICKRRGWKVEPLVTWRHFDPTLSAQKIIRELKQTTLRDHYPSQIVIDSNGVGAGTHSTLLHAGYPVEGFMSQWGSAEPHIYANMRAQCYWQMREAFKRGQVCLPDDDELVAQLTSIKYHENPRTGLIQIENKEETRKRGLPSPDRPDALMQTHFMEPNAEDMDADRYASRKNYSHSTYEYDEYAVE
jgi:hypothetical protein